MTEWSEKLRKAKLSERAKTILRLVDERTGRWCYEADHERAGRFWYGGTYDKWESVETEDKSRKAIVDGAAWASVLRGLERKGLIEVASRELSYAFRTTEEGHGIAEQIRHEDNS